MKAGGQFEGLSALLPPPPKKGWWVGFSSITRQKAWCAPGLIRVMWRTQFLPLLGAEFQFYFSVGV